MAEVGDQLVFSDQVVVQEQSLKVDEEVTFRGQRGNSSFIVNVPAATLTDIDSTAFAQHVTYGSYRIPGASIRFIGKDGQAAPPEKAKVWVSTAADRTTLHADLKLGSSVIAMDLPNAPITRILCTNVDHDGMRREILYGGVVKNVLMLQYREYLGGVARPAFSQEGSFDLSAGTEIAFKGVHVKVLGAANTGIRYMVTAGFAQ